MLSAARAALATFEEMFEVAAFCCSIEAATPDSLPWLWRSVPPAI